MFPWWAFALRYTIISQKKIESKDSCLIFMPCRLITIVDKHDKLDTKRNSTFDSLLPNTNNHDCIHISRKS